MQINMLILCFYFDGTEQIKSKQKAYDVNFSGIESTFFRKRHKVCYSCYSCYSCFGAIHIPKFIFIFIYIYINIKIIFDF